MAVKLRYDFFEDKAIRSLLKREDGYSIVVFYLRLLLMASRNRGWVVYEYVGESMPDEIALSTDLDQKFVVNAILALRDLGLCFVVGNDIRVYRPHVARERNSPEYKVWRRAVFERDNYTCQKCKKRGVRIEAHHIKSWAYFPELRFEVSNGITFCDECHKKEHKLGGLDGTKENV